MTVSAHPGYLNVVYVQVPRVKYLPKAKGKRGKRARRAGHRHKVGQEISAADPIPREGLHHLKIGKDDTFKVIQRQQSVKHV